MNIRFENTVGDTLDRLHDRKLQPVRAIPTPFPSWNAICGEEGGGEGLAETWLVVIGGVTGTGKSYLALNLAAHAVTQGVLVGTLNFEMTQTAVVTRYLSILTGFPKWEMDMGAKFNSAVWLAAQKEADRIYQQTGGSFITNQTPIYNLRHVEQSYETLATAGAKLIIVDYAQLVMVPGVNDIFGRSESVAIRLRELTHEYKVATVCISQFNREEARRGKPPSIHGLMGGGIWEHAASQIWLHNHTLRERYGRTPDGRYQGEYTEIINGKNRHGIAPFELPVKWSYRNMRFDEYVPGTDPHDPFFDDDLHTVELKPDTIHEPKLEGFE